MNMLYGADKTDEKAFLVPSRCLRFFSCDEPLHRFRSYVKCRDDGLRYRFHFHLSGSFDQDPVILFQMSPERGNDLLGFVKKGDPLLREALFSAPLPPWSARGFP